jgi:pyruvate dehydrogenase E2 component (dihydrolipoamide acetyltransferase)
MDIIMPQLGETVLEGVITAWYKKPGEPVAADESLFEVETDKVSTAIPSPVPGVVREILVDAGVSVKVGTRLAVIDAVSEAVTTPVAAAPDGNAMRDAPRPTVAAQAAVAQLVTTRIPGRLGRSANKKLSPVVRRLLAEAGLAAEQVQGSGRDGRITREDVLGRIGHTTGGSAQPPAPPARGSAAPARLGPAIESARVVSPTQRAAVAPAAEQDLPHARTAPQHLSASQEDRVVPLNKIRRATAAHMVRSIATSVHTLQAVEVDFQNVERARNAKGADWKAKEGFTLTYLPFVCAATCEALGDFPLINATFDNDSLIVHRRINLGIAVDLGFDGLLVPVLRDANHKNLRGLARETHALVQSARANTLTADDLSGGTYTISNSGSFGTLITAPIINQPQVAILSLDGVHKKPAVIEGPDGDAIAIRPIGVLAQSFDHRAFDGAYSAAFLRRLKQTLETRNWLAELS